MQHPIKDDHVEKYLPFALDILLAKSNPSISNLSTKERVIVTKIIHNINRLCKLSKKEVIEALRTAPSYQPVLAEIFFEQSINDWRLITNDTEPHNSAISLTRLNESSECVGMEYKIELTLSSISEKKTVKPSIFMVFFMVDGSKFQVYLSLAEFSKFRYQVANAMKSMHTIEMRTLF